MRGLNALDHDITGDGVTDETAAIQDFLDECATAKLHAYFPGAGRQYKVTSTIDVPPYVVMLGSSQVLPYRAIDEQAPVFLCSAGSGGLTTPQFSLDVASGMKGFTFYYPANQPTTVTPTQYGYTIAANTGLAYNPDNIVLENLMLLNSYQGISLDKAAFFNLRNIHGQPLYRGIYADRIYGNGQMEHVLFWDFFCTVGDALNTWLKANARAYDFRRVDHMDGRNLVAYGYNQGVYFGDAGNGSCWGTFTACAMDICNVPVTIDKANAAEWFGGNLTTGILDKPTIVTGTDIAGSMKFIGTTMMAGSGLGAHVKSTTGQLSFEGCDWRPTALSGLSSWHLINEGACEVHIDGGNIRPAKIAGGPTTYVNGVPHPTLSTDITPAGMNTYTNWTGSGPSPVVTSVSGGQRFAANTDANLYTFALPTGSIRQNVIVVEFDYTPSNTTDVFMLFDVRNTGHTQSIGTIMDATDWYVPACHMRIPFWVGEHADSLIFMVAVHTYAGTINLDFTNFKVWSCAPSALTSQMIETIIRPRYLNPASRTTDLLSVRGNGFRTVPGDAAPAAGAWIVGDVITARAPAAAGNIGWVCTTAGSPGTWKTYGAIAA